MNLQQEEKLGLIQLRQQLRLQGGALRLHSLGGGLNKMDGWQWLKTVKTLMLCQRCFMGVSGCFYVFFSSVPSTFYLMDLDGPMVSW